jgi:hypothetical protein
MTKLIANGNQTVAITANDAAGPFSARVYVNTRNGFENGDATLVARKFKTLAGAEKWAAKELAR